MGRLLRRLRAWLLQRQMDAALAQELEFHRELKQRELEAGGLSSADAALATRRAMGNVARAREDARAVWVWPWLESVWQDATYALRSLRGQPAFTLVVVGVLGVAIGLNASLFTVFAGFTVRPMSGLSDPARVVRVSGSVPMFPDRLVGISFLEFDFLRQHSRTMVGLAAKRTTSLSLEAQGVGSTTSAQAVTGNYFDVLGVRMLHGRGFLPEEDRRGAARAVAVLSHALWRARFAGDPRIVGASIRLNDIPHTVVGIASPDFKGSEGSTRRLWVPLSSLPTLRPHDPFDANLLDRADCCVEVFGRLSEGGRREQAQSELQILSDRFRATASQESRPVVVGGTEFFTGRRSTSTALAIIGALFVGIVLVLLVACANVGNLLLARAASRASEIGVRLSLGAGRARIVRQLMTEGLVLALMGSLVGVAMSAWLPSLVVDRLAGEPAPFDIGADGLVIAYAMALAAVACVAFALAPALHVTRGNLAGVLKAAATQTRAAFPLRSLLLGVQVAVTVVLLTTAGLLLRGVAAARLVDLGFDPDTLAVATIELPQGAYHTARAQTLLADLTTGLEAAGVGPFGFVSTEPLGFGSFMTSLRLPGEGADRARPIEIFRVSAGYFGTLGIPMTAGRGFVEADAGRNVAIVNESAARRYWPGDNPVGRTLFEGGRSVEVIGVVKDAHVDTPDEIAPLIFEPLDNATDPRGERLAKLVFDSRRASSITAVTAIVNRLEPRARVTVTPLGERVDEWLAELSMAPLAASALGLFGLGLATVGMFGVFAYVVRQRTREIGIRIALGATRGQVMRLVLTGSSRAVIAGLAAGTLGAIGASQVLREWLYGLSPLDPLTYGGVAALLAASAMAASYVPARRAARLDPAQALRE
jgi:predicted permease